MTSPTHRVSPTRTYLIIYYIQQVPTQTLEKLKAYKGLDTYNQFVSGWVRELGVFVYNENIRLHTSRVLYSQSPSQTAHAPWLIIETDGRVLAAHCNCMAGLGETCTHLAATLFALEAAVKLRDSRTITKEKSYWLPPAVKDVPYSDISNIDTSAKNAKRNVDCKLSGTCFPQRKHYDRRLPKPTTLEKMDFFQTGFARCMSIFRYP